ncbi:ANTAR domain-containing response regulator [Vibrio alginolyticus]|uniref:ANTAR domain-containing response regulator n=1 Tax=Vibrio TaxID=662 RepID=UPI0005084AAF|nr:MULTISPECIES: ANTAR domain-containing protein [Vibrio]EHI5143438.1 ANTAR domain-containing protein [Vibrio alginolyticus]EJL6784465.1 ANTAR domain-containing protein [Vibrio alginolyticus]EJN3357262.1 ANTAR domain-containing protein [Vibrio alginolyticus]EJR0950956.1 ANTAR domain-containing protein [Vibrio alginolyticus]EJS0369124.1 ANTAR domain-containing protein [Vibrio alginolyticus]
MTQSTSKTPIIVCCDSLQEQARLSGLLSKDYDNIMGCQLAQLETLMQREPSASVVVGWQQPTAELRLIVDFCRRKSAPLLIVLKQLSSNDINRLSEKMDYVLMPHDSEFALQPWIEHATLVRAKFESMQSEIELLTNKIEERKLVEKAKGLLMKMHSVDEGQAYKALRNSAMQSSQTLAQVAKNLITTLEVLD